jgi:hypothetical protein
MGETFEVGEQRARNVHVHQGVSVIFSKLDGSASGMKRVRDAFIWWSPRFRSFSSFRLRRDTFERWGGLRLSVCSDHGGLNLDGVLLMVNGQGCGGERITADAAIARSSQLNMNWRISGRRFVGRFN